MMEYYGSLRGQGGHSRYPFYASVPRAPPLGSSRRPICPSRLHPGGLPRGSMTGQLQAQPGPPSCSVFGRARVRHLTLCPMKAGSAQQRPLAPVGLRRSHQIGPDIARPVGRPWGSMTVGLSFGLMWCPADVGPSWVQS